MINSETSRTARKVRAGSITEVLLAFLKLGFTSFGGPIAHLGYIRDELVLRRKWVDDTIYADLVALCQFLPGPASSQVGFALGLLRGGPMGALAAWIGFTLPSAIFLYLFALWATAFDGPLMTGIVSGLKIVAVAIVAQAVWGMAKNLCPDRERATIALSAVLIAILSTSAFGQVAAIAVGAMAGLVFCRSQNIQTVGHLSFPVTRTFGVTALVLFGVLLIALPIAASAIEMQGLAIFDAFYRAGSLVFGGGHVVLPLLETEVVKSGWVSHDQFLTGYGAAQAVPGPLFTFAAYLGTVLQPAPNGIVGATLALVAVFVPGFLLLIGVLPFWDGFRRRPNAQALMRGANAAVVGILGAALYNPVFTSAIIGPYEFTLALTCFVLLVVWKFAPWLVVIIGATGGVLTSNF